MRGRPARAVVRPVRRRGGHGAGRAEPDGRPGRAPRARRDVRARGAGAGPALRAGLEPRAAAAPVPGRRGASAVVARRRAAGGERGALRDAMRRLRMGELREGVWTRPDNLPRASAPAEAWRVADAQCRWWSGRPDDDRGRRSPPSCSTPRGWADGAPTACAHRLDRGDGRARRRRRPHARGRVRGRRGRARARSRRSAPARELGPSDEAGDALRARVSRRTRRRSPARCERGSAPTPSLALVPVVAPDQLLADAARAAARRRRRCAARSTVRPSSGCSCRARRNACSTRSTASVSRSRTGDDGHVGRRRSRGRSRRADRAVARRHGRAADARGHGPRVRERDRRVHARVRSRRAHRDARRRGPAAARPARVAARARCGFMFQPGEEGLPRRALHDRRGRARRDVDAGVRAARLAEPARRARCGRRAGRSWRRPTCSRSRSPARAGTRRRRTSRTIRCRSRPRSCRRCRCS